jgi:hypothetical protein
MYNLKMNKRIFNFNEPPKPVEPTVTMRICKECGNDYRMSMVLSVEDGFICTKCLINKIDNKEKIKWN